MYNAGMDTDMTLEIKKGSIMAHEGDYEKGLNPTERLFLQSYLRNWNIIQAAEEAGIDDPTFYEADKLFKKVEPAILARLEGELMNEEELLFRLVEIARGMRHDEMDDFGFVDIKKLKARGRTYLIKGIKRSFQAVTFEMHDSMRALELVGKILGVIKDRRETEGYGRVDHYFPQLDEMLTKVYGDERVQQVGEDLVEGKIRDVSSAGD